jgi:pyruvate/2-oxoglutarate/acetoin dehydrogenase E1 component/pyruvate/2-oxoglutarate dehydrogenase complex dihydrolipoamide acyltransferase (E2) component
MAEHLNRTLHGLFAADPDLFLLGEDIADPYGGAFRVSKGLSTAYPDRVITTPLSENGFMGVANGLALAGNRVIAEVMFGDFLGLAFDQLVNFAATSVSMYGRTLPMPVLVRCPVGGHRAYGPTHSQSPQKHLIGVPNLAVYELSQLHDAAEVYRAAFERAAPAVMVEHKVVYTQRRFLDGMVDDAFAFEALPGPGMWTRVRPVGGPVSVVVIVSGGMLGAALTSARELAAEHGIGVELLVPAQLYPLALDPVLNILAAVGAVVVAEESTAGGTWGNEVAAGLHTALWHELRAPVALVHSRASIIPAAPHLERAVLAQPADITAAARRLAGAPDPRRRNAGAEPPAATQTVRPIEAVQPTPAGASHPVTVPTLNANDDSCILIEWLRDDGQLVEAGDPIAVLETAKSAADLEAERSGRLRRVRQAGEDCEFGSVIAYLDDPSAPPATGGAARPQTPGVTAGSARARVQAAVAANVSLSHRTIPAAFCTARVGVDAALAALRDLTDRTGAVVDLAALVVKAVGLLRPDFPDFFGTVTGDGTLHRATRSDIGVTVDADNGLFVPVVRDVETRGLEDIADDLMSFRMQALEGRFEDGLLAGGALSVSLNLVDGVDVVQPLVVPPQVAVVSIGGVGRELRLGPAGAPVEAAVVTFGLGYDHRVVNGRAAALFIAALKGLLERPMWIDG